MGRGWPPTHHIPAPAPVNTTFIQPPQGGPPSSFHSFYFSYLLRSFNLSSLILLSPLLFGFHFSSCSNIIILFFCLFISFFLFHPDPSFLFFLSSSLYYFSLPFLSLFSFSLSLPLLHLFSTEAFSLYLLSLL
jgi:hypothetical protein